MRMQVIYYPASAGVLVALLLRGVYIYLCSEGVQIGRVRYLTVSALEWCLGFVLFC